MVVDRDKFEAWMALARFRKDMRDVRSARLWQALLAAWTGLALLAIQGEHLELPIRMVLAGAAFVLLTAWSLWHAQSAERDQSIMFHYHDKASALLGAAARPKELKAPHPKSRRWFNHALVWMQIGTTLLLCLALVFAPSAASMEKGPSRESATATDRGGR